MITVANLHPDVLFETDQGLLIHTELQGYRQDDFARRNLLYFALVLRDYDRPPMQIVFWLGPGKVAIAGGLSHPPAIEYQYRVIDVREIDGDWLLDGGDIEESIFAILCRLRDQREAVALILKRISLLPAPQQQEAAAELLILSGLRGLKALVKEEITRMPVSIDIHENEFLEEIYQEGIEKGIEQGIEKAAREMLTDLLEQKFGKLPSESQERIQTANVTLLRQWTRRLSSSNSLDQLFQ
jgi:predicted transposase YdaD